MAQHDMEITTADANTGVTVRAAINAALQALVSNSSGATEPAIKYAYQLWADTTTGLLKQRNAANTAWIIIGTLASVNLGLATLLSPTFTGTVTIPTPFTLGAVSVLPTGTELNFVDGVTSAIQTQIDGKQASDATLISLAALGTAADKMAYTTGVDIWAEAVITAVGRALIAAASVAAQQAILNPARVQSVADAATITPDADANDAVDITAIAQAFTIANPTGTPTNFQKLRIRIKDNAIARAITWGTAYVAGGLALPLTTVISKITNVGLIYNTANALNKWQCVAVSQEA